MTLWQLKDWKLHRALTFAARKDGAVNESSSVVGNADPNLVDLSVTLCVLITVYSWKMAVKGIADRPPHHLNLIMLAVWNYSCKSRSHYLDYA